MALSSASIFNPLSLSFGDRGGRKNFSVEASKNRVESRCCLSPSSCSNVQFGLVGRDLAWTFGTRKNRGGRRLVADGIRRLTVCAVENDRSSESGSGGEVDVDAIESRLGLGRRARKQQKSGGEGSDSKPGASAGSAKKSSTAKTWEKMSLPEKAWSLYIDPKKGVLFWLNKLAYAAIFAIIGGWIVFRFIGPALGWYELDQPLLAPDRIFNASP